MDSITSPREDISERKAIGYREVRGMIVPSSIFIQTLSINSIHKRNQHMQPRIIQSETEFNTTMSVEMMLRIQKIDEAALNINTRK